MTPEERERIEAILGRLALPGGWVGERDNLVWLLDLVERQEADIAAREATGTNVPNVTDDLSPEGRNLAPADQPLTVAEARGLFFVHPHLHTAVARLEEAVRREERERYSELEAAVRVVRDECSVDFTGPLYAFDDLWAALARLGGPQPAQEPNDA